MHNADMRVGAVGRARASVAALATLHQIRAEGRTFATDDERAILAGWSGWGPLRPSFAPKDNTWANIHADITRLLPADDVETGMQGTYNAFYTPAPVAAAMWRMLAGLGFTGGPVLEPGCGGGVFMATAPAEAAMVGVDRDPTAVAVCRLLHPQAQIIHSSFQDARLPGGFAAAVGNVPFGDVAVFDPGAPKAVTGSLHDYFIWRTLDLLAPGGIAVLVTSRYTMDKTEDAARHAIRALADLVGAFRLPNGALEGGTDSAADVLVLRRRTDGRDAGRRWMDTDRERFGWYAPVSRYWETYPDAVFGEMRAGRTSQHGLTIEVVRRDDDPPAAELLNRAVDGLVEDAEARRLLWEPFDDDDEPAVESDASPEGWHNGSIRFRDDEVVRVEGGRLVPVERPSKELRALLQLRDLAVQLVAFEADHSMGDALIAPLRAQTAAAYHDYVRQFGALNRYKPVTTYSEVKPGTELWNDVQTGAVPGEYDDTGRLVVAVESPRYPLMGGFRKDPDAGLVFALEVYDDEAQTAGPAPILSARQNLPVARPSRTDDPGQALAWCLNYRAGAVDLDYIAGLLGVDAGQVPGMLGDAVFCDPATRDWVPAEEYLSGNVRRKLAVAERAAQTLPEYGRNVAALQAVLPAWLGPADIAVHLGSPFVDGAEIVAFVQALLRQRVTVRRAPQTAQWEIDVVGWARESVAATAEWGTADKDAYQLIELALNGRVPVVYREVTIGGEVKKRKDAEASLLASEKQTQLKERFAEWVWECPQRTDRIVELYNRRFNSLVARRFSGAHITVDGLAPWFKPYPHQLEWVARAVATPAALCGHPVGAGKTASMAMTAMKLRQLGVVRKPLVVVPNHLIEQVDREFRQLFPGARILSASAGTIAANRRAFNARCATQDWDIILVTHSAFDRMPVSAKTERTYIREQIVELEEAIRAGSPDGKLKGRMVSGLAKRKDNLAARLAELRHRKAGHDRGVTFEQMGVDFILLDEAHYYKNLAVPVRTDGFSVRPSKRATDLDVKLSWLAQRGTGRYAALFTGTPVSNTMLELYVVLRYLMPEHLKTIGLGSADAWAATFVQFVTQVGVTVDGGQFQLITRPQQFVNAPELRVLLSQVADIRTADQLGLKRPASQVETVVCQRTTKQAEYSAELVDRVEAIKARTDPNSRDNMLAVCGDGRRMATDPRLVGVRDDEPGKLDAAAAKMLQVWREHPTELQIAFCDVGTPQADRGSQTYGRLRAKLVAGGMDPGRVRFIHDAKNDGVKAALFADCRAGKVSVILGSTDKLGVGTNIQKRVVAMHHVDAPYRPADVAQRDGRGLRPGNQHQKVRVFRYVTERTFDAYMWQMLLRKAQFIEQILSGQVGRTIGDCSSDVLDEFAAIKAAATGQPLLLEQAKVEAEVKRLRGLQRGHKATVDRLHRDIARRREAIGTNTRLATAWEAVAGKRTGRVDGDDDVLHEACQSFGRRRGTHTFAGVPVDFREWWTSGEDAERHPLLVVDCGAGPVELRAYRFWEAPELAQKLWEFVASAEVRAEGLRRKIESDAEENGRAAELAARPFADGDALTAALARLDQIEAALHAAAVTDVEVEVDDVADGGQVSAEPLPEPLPDVVIEVGERTDMPDDATEDDEVSDGEVTEFFAGLLAELEAEVADGFAELFGDLLAM